MSDRQASGTENAAVSHATWSSGTMFVLAAAGSAVGLGNIWKFPYITGVYGGGAFVILYLAFILAMGLPVMMTEILIGRRGGKSPIGSMRSLALAAKASPYWKWVGGAGILAAFLIVSFYSVIAGWAINYVGVVFDPRLDGTDSEISQVLFGELLASPWTLLLWHTVFVVMTVAVSLSGVRAGLERAVSYLMPTLFVMLILLNVYAMTTGYYGEALGFLFEPDFSELTWGAVLLAAGHAFFSLSLGSGIMMAYGSYLRRQDSIMRTSVTICILDTVVALMAGLAIFTVIFAEGLQPAEGPGLMFVSLPLAFAHLPAGEWFGALFFLMVVVAAWTSAISLLEPLVEWLEEKGLPRKLAAIIPGFLVWLLGITTVLSFNVWSDVHPLGFIAFFEGKTFFDLLDYFTSNVMLPLVALMATVFAAWVMSREATSNELGVSAGVFQAWLGLSRYLIPVLIGVIFVLNLA